MDGGTGMRCPKGHPLTDLITPSLGSCDGCYQQVAAGQHVMDCMICNWYLCNHCSQTASAPFKGADAGVEVIIDEVLQGTAEKEKAKTWALGRAGKYNVKIYRC